MIDFSVSQIFKMLLFFQQSTEDRISIATGDISSGSSRTSSPEPIGPAKPIQTQTQFLAQHGPPIPPRSAPPPVPPPGVPMRQKSLGNQKAFTS